VPVFRIRRIYDDALALDREAIRQVQEMLRIHFPGVPEKDIEKLPQQLRNPLKYRFRSILFVADDLRGRLRGFALLLHAPDLEFGYLDYLSAEPGKVGGGVGGALYERVRDETRFLSAEGLFFECLPDDPVLCPNPDILKTNRARLRFYERYGARPIIRTAYETPLKPGEECPPYLAFDSLGKETTLSRDRARVIVRAILERKYGKSCPPGYIDRVVDSFRDDPVRLRAPRHVHVEGPKKEDVRLLDKSIALVVNDQHAIHHVHERGYVESPVRIRSILRGIEGTALFNPVPPKHFSERFIKQVHDVGFVEYLKRVCTRLEARRSVYPYVFPIRNSARPPKELPIRAGYYCMDTFTPLNRNAYTSAKRAVDCALTAAEALLQGYRLAYALVRPPGHHAERRIFGGFCYFNSAAVAAQYLSPHGRTAVLDIDYHHGNGTQEIFYDRADIMTVSIHGHPQFAYPFFSGFSDERGTGAGLGYNVNYPLEERIDGPHYLQVLRKAVSRLIQFRPHFLVLSLGFDTAKGDPTGTWTLTPADFEANGRVLGALKLPTLVVQEGGYRIRSLAANARHFFRGLSHGAQYGAFSGNQPPNLSKAKNNHVPSATH